MKVRCIDNTGLKHLTVGEVYTVRLESSKSYILTDFPKGENEFAKKLFIKES